MRFWWVNHKQTFRAEFGGGYVWCPKRKKDGRLNHFYETVREVRPGDVVFSYAFAAVQGIGIARTHAYSCPRPDEFGVIGEAWDRTGWRADVGFSPLPQPLRTAEHADRLAHLLPERYSPITPQGTAYQHAYFAEIPRPLASALLMLAAPRLAPTLLGQETREEETAPLFEVDLAPLKEWEDRQERVIREAADVPETTRQALVLARVGQGRFKQEVGRIERACRITGVANPAHLIASHIKPWRESDNAERLEPSNGLLLTPTIDHLFDRGFISFADDGDVIVSTIADRESLAKMGIPAEGSINVGRFNIDQRHFLDYHRREILLQSAG